MLKHIIGHTQQGNILRPWEKRHTLEIVYFQSTKRHIYIDIYNVPIDKIFIKKYFCTNRVTYLTINVNCATYPRKLSWIPLLSSRPLSFIHLLLKPPVTANVFIHQDSSCKRAQQATFINRINFTKHLAFFLTIKLRKSVIPWKNSIFNIDISYKLIILLGRSDQQDSGNIILWWDQWWLGNSSLKIMINNYFLIIMLIS